MWPKCSFSLLHKYLESHILAFTNPRIHEEIPSFVTYILPCDCLYVRIFRMIHVSAIEIRALHM